MIHSGFNCACQNYFSVLLKSWIKLPAWKIIWKVTVTDNLPFSECYVWDMLWFTETYQAIWYQPRSLSRWSIGYHHIYVFSADILISFVSFLCVTLSEWNWHVMVINFVAIFRPTLFVGEFTHGLYALPSMVDANRTAIAVSSKCSRCFQSYLFRRDII